jgi:hypothetical protein
MRVDLPPQRTMPPGLDIEGNRLMAALQREIICLSRL